MSVTFDNPSNVPAPLADRFSNVAVIDLGSVTMLVMSGQVALDKDGEIVGDSVTTQSEQVFRSIEGLLSAYGAGFEHVVNIRTYLTDMDTLGEYAAVRRKHFTGTPPTSTTVEVSGLFRPEVLVEVEITAIVAKIG